MKPKNLIKRGINWYFRGTIDGRQVWKSLETSDQKLAASRARKLRDALSAGRWEVLTDLSKRNTWSLLREALEAYDRYVEGSTLRPQTVRANKQALVRIVREAQGITEEAALSSRVSVLTAQLLRDYQAAKIATAKEEGPVAVERAKSTTYSTARQARSVFSRDCLSSSVYGSLVLPDLSGFLTCRLKSKSHTLRERPSQELIEATAKAAKALQDTNPERWLAFILCSNLGLRKSEAVSARWDWVEEIHVTGQARDDKGILKEVTRTIHVMSVIKRDSPEIFDPKGSARMISIHPETWRQMETVRTSIDTIIPGTKREREKACVANVSWLRELGWNVRLPNHALRGLYGSRVAMEHGLFTAQSRLGHRDPRTTTDHYAVDLGFEKVTKVF